MQFKSLNNYGNIILYMHLDLRLNFFLTTHYMCK